mgnify:FL=1
MTKEINELKAASYDAALADSIYTADELEIRKEYYSLYDRLITADSSMSDEEYDLITNSNDNSSLTFKFKIVELFENIKVKLANS